MRCEATGPSRTRPGRLIECKHCQDLLVVHSSFLQRLKYTLKPARLIRGPDGGWLCQKHHHDVWEKRMEGSG